MRAAAVFLTLFSEILVSAAIAATTAAATRLVSRSNAAANACRCAAVAAQAAAQANSGCCGCGCGCGCGCRRRVAVPITGRIYLELPYGGFGAQAAEATTGTGGGCTMCNTAVTGVNANGGGFDSYYARQYGLYPYSATNTCGCGN